MARRRAPTCEVRHASDGTPMRVRGGDRLTQDDLDALNRAVSAFFASRCGAPSTVPVPVRSQRDEVRTYACGLAADHDPDEGHRWPTEGTLIVAWCDWPRARP